MSDEKLNPEYVVTLQGQQYATYKGVLDLAHRMGLRSLETKLLQTPSEENGQVAIVEAIATQDIGDGAVRTFCDIGDASPKNVNARLVSAIIRFASTRAKGRALRDMVNIGEAIAEELPDEPEPQASAPKETAARPPAQPVAAATVASPAARPAAQPPAQPAAARPQGNGKPDGCRCLSKSHATTNPKCPLNTARAGGGQ